MARVNYYRYSEIYTNLVLETFNLVQAGEQPAVEELAACLPGFRYDVDAKELILNQYHFKWDMKSSESVNFLEDSSIYDELDSFFYGELENPAARAALFEGVDGAVFSVPAIQTEVQRLRACLQKNLSNYTEQILKFFIGELEGLVEYLRTFATRGELPTWD